MNQSDQKQKKAKGPIRFEAIVPLCIVVALVGLYFTVFFDGHLRRAIEFGATYANGAEVNIGTVKTSFLKGDFALYDLQVTSLSDPKTNSVQIGKMHFQFLWDALLRAKIVIRDASISNLQVGTPRKYPGRITKKPDPIEKTSEADTKGNALADAGKLFEGALDLSALKSTGELKSTARVNQLQADLKEREKQWNSSIQSLPTGKDIQSLQGKLTSIKIGGTNNPAEIQKQIQSVQSLIGEVNDKSNKVKAVSESVQKGLSEFQGSMKQLESAVQEDIRDLESKLKLPSLDTESLAKQFFGDKVLSQMSQVKRYMALARKYMPAKSKEKDDSNEVEAPTRQVGRNIHFPVNRGYPLFWLQRAALSSKSENSPFGGDVSGEIKDVCSRPSQIGKPTTINFEGNFPAPGIMGVEAKIILDHTGDIAKQSVNAQVAQFPVSQQMLSNSESLQFGFDKALGAASLKAFAEGPEVSLNLGTKFRDIKYVVKAQSNELGSLLQGAVRDVNLVTVDADAKGRLSDMHWTISSNLASELQRGFERQFKAKLDEAKAQIQKIIDERIGKQKKELTDRFAGAQSAANKQVTEKQKEVDKLKGQAQAKLNQAQNQAKNQLQNQGKKEAEKLLKGLKF